MATSTVKRHYRYVSYNIIIFFLQRHLPQAQFLTIYCKLMQKCITPANAALVNGTGKGFTLRSRNVFGLLLVRRTNDHHGGRTFRSCSPTRSASPNDLRSFRSPSVLVAATRISSATTGRKSHATEVLLPRRQRTFRTPSLLLPVL